MRGRREVAQQMPGNGTFPELVETSGVARQASFEMVANLAIEGSAFGDEVATMANDELQLGPRFVACGFEQSTTGDGGAVDGREVPVVGLVAGIDGLAVLLGNEGMENARLETGGDKSALHEAVIAARAFDGNEAIPELVVSKRPTNLRDGGIEIRTVMGDFGGWNEVATIEVGEEKLGAGLMAVKADDSELFGTDLLDTWVQHSAKLADRDGCCAPGRTTMRMGADHEKSLQKELLGSSHFRSWRSEGIHLLQNPHTRGQARLLLILPGVMSTFSICPAAREPLLAAFATM